MMANLLILLLNVGGHKVYILFEYINYVFVILDVLV
jgi:hypothetical protein